MRRSHKPLPIPQHEFGFMLATFNLIQETGIDFARVAREREQAEQARKQAEAAPGSAGFFPSLRPRGCGRLSVKLPI